MSSVVIEAAQLREMRAEYVELHTMFNTLTRRGHFSLAEPVGRAASELGNTEAFVKVNCLGCGRRETVPVMVNDAEQTVPTGCLCRDCNERIEGLALERREDIVGFRDGSPIRAHPESGR